MNLVLNQENRPAILTTMLGETELVLLRFTGQDAVNDLFEYRVEAVSLNADIDLNALMGTHAHVAFSNQQHGPRFYDGIITDAETLGVGDGGYLYSLTLRPWLWLADQRQNQRIFHNKTVVEIIEEVFGDWAEASQPLFDNRLLQDYPVLEYTVQFGETDRNFICRQMERFGINYCFDHQAGAHTLVMTDDPLSFSAIAGGTRDYYNSVEDHNADDEHFWDWQSGRGLTTGAVKLTDFNFKTPKASMQVSQLSNRSHPHGQIESYAYPGDYLEAGTGKGLSQTRLKQIESADHRQRIVGNAPSLSSGMSLDLTGDDIPGRQAGTLICLEARHSYSANGYQSGGSGGDMASFSGEYVLTPVDAPILPPRKTHVPRIHGPQTAMVVGEGEIDCDEYGRVLVHFHWDLQKAYSMRCRVLQHSAAGEYGGMVIPRIGMEAVVEFLEGDPDKPLVTGCVFNGKTDRPYSLPAHKTKHVIRADTHEGAGFNEISFEAQAGQENMAIHAQKDQTIRVLNDQSANISANRVEQIGANASLNVAANSMERVGANKNISVGGGGMGLLKMLMPLVQAGGKFMKKGANKAGSGAGVGGFAGVVAGVSDLPNELAAIAMKGQFTGSGGHRSAGGADQLGKGATMARLLQMIMPSTGTMNVTVEKYKKETVGAGSTEQVGLAKNVLVGNVLTTSVGKLMQTKVGEDYDLETKKSIFSRTRKHTLHAKDKFVIGGPGGTIIIDNSGITIKTKHLKVKSPKVDFTSGAPDQVDALKSDKPFAQDCKGK
ncbi:type VI secretion system Vgr family protein [Sulfitobacter geojensis]|uniref:Type VI secretion system tip protein VgrG n=1 Tax=Sulfitobacter geojensis TaxID=1342299 RepID=A0AAE2W1P6_9RHOB|nr:type VI secretion system tip protein TssI/VgrG [Sulfitobacter geojensis]MBM1691277.1 type VI secretion system tip protein VgrG [Sulfitobacter geojensis]MBM1695400.1 type VI secretion system tip protein VgrG [Sulfitobacter geojensis]MBM1707500.1 type VI secretion system tip protein VgrG [Sulfitobacter geojensis]MBM1711593.1 type VI secretion system tip protein VgrG [Sulfitobacter geojensis]MBM1715568.1 type VI secretion system tip protein VgrG [Sulfitobacter geojensis]